MSPHRNLELHIAAFADDLKGQFDGDILIAGLFQTSDREQALRDALDIWTRTDVNFAQRVAVLQDQYFNTSTVLDDDDRDVLKGQNGSDWYFLNLSQDRVQTEMLGEVLTHIAAELLGFESAGNKGKTNGRK